jgi:hypothetical protein
MHFGIKKTKPLTLADPLGAHLYYSRAPSPWLPSHRRRPILLSLPPHSLSLFSPCSLPAAMPGNQPHALHARSPSRARQLNRPQHRATRRTLGPSALTRDSPGSRREAARPCVHPAELDRDHALPAADRKSTLHARPTAMPRRSLHPTRLNRSPTVRPRIRLNIALWSLISSVFLSH